MPSGEDWTRLINKKARGIDNFDLGEVKEVDLDYVNTERRFNHKECFTLPKQMVIGYDNTKVLFRVTEKDATSVYLRTRPLVNQKNVSHWSK